MRDADDREGVRRPRISWKLLVLAGLVLFGALGYLHLATRKFAWWKESAFAGEVVGKEARERESDAIVRAAPALEDPARHRFFLRIAADDKRATEVHEVIPSLFGTARVGDHVEKRAGSYRSRRVPAAGGQPAGPET